jgi:hypothetical protein
MTTLATTEEANRIELERPIGQVIVREYIGSIQHMERGPQAFTSTMPPGYEITPHYHLADQCQVFVEGSATMPGHETEPVTLHYADAYTAYGPINCGSEGLMFFNFRPRCDIGVERMPESRKGMHIRGGREIVAECRLSLTDDVETLRLETLIDPHPDGLAAYEMVAAPGVQLIDVPASGSGRFHLILDGELELDGRTLPKHSVGHLAPGERFGARRAGPAGAHVLELQFPSE